MSLTRPLSGPRTARSSGCRALAAMVGQHRFPRGGSGSRRRARQPPQGDGQVTGDGTECSRRASTAPGARSAQRQCPSSRPKPSAQRGLAFGDSPVHLFRRFHGDAMADSGHRPLPGAHHARNRRPGWHRARMNAPAHKRRRVPTRVLPLRVLPSLSGAAQELITHRAEQPAAPAGDPGYRRTCSLRRSPAP